jgi:hypothetical protein
MVDFLIIALISKRLSKPLYTRRLIERLQMLTNSSNVEVQKKGKGGQTEY